MHIPSWYIGRDSISFHQKCQTFSGSRFSVCRFAAFLYCMLTDVWWKVMLHYMREESHSIHIWEDFSHLSAQTTFVPHLYRNSRTCTNVQMYTNGHTYRCSLCSRSIKGNRHTEKAGAPRTNVLLFSYQSPLADVSWFPRLHGHT